MIATQQKIYTFTEYLNYQDSTDNKYELFNGELIPMPPASGFHALILAFIYDYLMAEIKRLNLTWKVMPATVGIRTDKAKSRIPDLMILSKVKILCCAKSMEVWAMYLLLVISLIPSFFLNGFLIKVYSEQ